MDDVGAIIRQMFEQVVEAPAQAPGTLRVRGTREEFFFCTLKRLLVGLIEQGLDGSVGPDASLLEYNGLFC